MPDALRIGLVAGSCHAQHCGVKDYALRLAQELRAAGLHAEVFAPAAWSWRGFLQLRRDLRAHRLDVVHVQYPSIGFRYSFLPHLLGVLGVARASCVTLHEYTALPLVQRLSLQLMRFTTRLILFTTAAERDAFEAIGNILGAPHTVVPIGSNLPALPPSPHPQRTVLYFGQIRPQKGIEDFLALAELNTGTDFRFPDFRFQVLGSVPERDRNYAAELRASAPASVEWIADESLEQIATRMASGFAAYLPFPDGATYRRGSLLGSLSNGLPVITTVRAQTPRELTAVVLGAETPAGALAQLNQLVQMPAERAAIAHAGLAFAEQFAWPSIAERHRLLYQGLITNANPGDRT